MRLRSDAKCPDVAPVFRGAIVKLPVKQVRGVGLMVGVELARRIEAGIAKMLNGIAGVIAGTNVIRFLPALNTTRAEVDEGCASLRRRCEGRT